MNSTKAYITTGSLVFFASIALTGFKISTSNQQTNNNGVSDSFDRNLKAASNKPRSAVRSEGSRQFRSLSGVSEILNQNDSNERLRSILDLVSGLVKGDFEILMANLQASGQRLQKEEYEIILHAWAKVDPVGALASLEGSFSYDEGNVVLACWAASDPYSALEWAEANFDGTNKFDNPYLAGVLKGMSAVDPQKASEILAEMKALGVGGKDQIAALETLAPFIVGQGPEKARGWLDSIGNKSMKSNAAVILTRTIALSNPKAAADLVTSLDDDKNWNSPRMEATKELATIWGANDNSAAVDWVETLEDQYKGWAATQIIQKYATENPSEAVQWLDSLADFDDYQYVVRNFIYGANKSDPALALSRISTNPDLSRHEFDRQYVLRKWHREDPQAAQAWMASNKVSDATRRFATATD